MKHSHQASHATERIELQICPLKGNPYHELYNQDSPHRRVSRRCLVAALWRRHNDRDNERRDDALVTYGRNELPIKAVVLQLKLDCHFVALAAINQATYGRAVLFTPMEGSISIGHFFALTESR